MFRDLQRDQSVFTDIAAHRDFRVHMSHGGRTIHGLGLQVSGSYFPILGLAPAAGRLFGPEVDAPAGGHPVAVLDHDFWQLELGGSHDVIGDALVVNGEPLTIVGVAPAGFEGTTLGATPLIFVPITMRGVLSPGDGGFEDRRNYWAYLFARLEPNVSLDQARAALAPLYRSILTEMEAPLHAGLGERRLAEFVAKPILLTDGRRGQSFLDDAVTPRLLLLFAVTGIVVLIACANVANLLLARLSARTAEVAVRLSIGATRRHLVVQLLTESCLLAILGGAAGLLVGHWTLQGLGTLLPAWVTRTDPSILAPAAVWFAMALSLGTGILFGIYPALHATRAGLVEALKEDAGQPAGARTASRFRAGLVAAQLALAMTLLAAAGLFIQSLRNVSRVDLGIRTENIVTFRLAPELNGYSPPQTQALFERVEDTLKAQPGVTGASASLIALFTGSSWSSSVMVEGFEPESDTSPSTPSNAIAPGYFETLGIPLLAGRTFEESDALDAPKVAIINEAFARMFGLGRDVVGKRMGQAGRGAELDMEIVGLVADAGYNDVKNPDPPLHYIPSRQRAGLGSLTFLRTDHAGAREPAADDPGAVGRAGPEPAGDPSQDAGAAGPRERLRRQHGLTAVGCVRGPRHVAGCGGPLRRAGLHHRPANARVRLANGARRGRSAVADPGARSSGSDDVGGRRGRDRRGVRGRPAGAAAALRDRRPDAFGGGRCGERPGGRGARGRSRPGASSLTHQSDDRTAPQVRSWAIWRRREPGRYPRPRTCLALRQEPCYSRSCRSTREARMKTMPLNRRPARTPHV